MGPVEGSAGAGGVNLLGIDLRWWAERRGSGGPVLVSVGDDGSGELSPGGRGPHLLEWCAEGSQPVLFIVEGLVEECGCTGFDQILPLSDCPTHVLGHGIGSFGNECGNQARALAASAGPCGPCRDGRYAVVEDGGDVVCIVEASCLDDAWHQCFEVVAVSFGPTELGSERPEGIRVDGVLSLLWRESGAADEVCPAVVLGGCGDRLVLGSELRKRSPLFLLGRDGFASGEFSTGMLKHPVQDRPGCGFGVVAEVWSGLSAAPYAALFSGLWVMAT